MLKRVPAISDTKAVIRPLLAELSRRGTRQVVVLSVTGVNPTVHHQRRAWVGA